MSQRKNTNGNSLKIKGYAKLQIINFVLYLTVFLILCLISLKTDLKKENMLYISLGFIGISSFLSGFIAGIKERKNGMACGLLSALPFNMPLLLVSLAFNSFKADLSIIYAVGTSLILSMAGGIISVNIRLK